MCSCSSSSAEAVIAAEEVSWEMYVWFWSLREIEIPKRNAVFWQMVDIIFGHTFWCLEKMFEFCISGSKSCNKSCLTSRPTRPVGISLRRALSSHLTRFLVEFDDMITALIMTYVLFSSFFRVRNCDSLPLVFHALKNSSKLITLFTITIKSSDVSLFQERVHPINA